MSVCAVFVRCEVSAAETCTSVKSYDTHSMTLLFKYLLDGGLPVLVCVCVCLRQVFDACQTDRNSGLTSCVGLGCWTKVFTWAVPLWDELEDRD